MADLLSGIGAQARCAVGGSGCAGFVAGLCDRPGTRENCTDFAGAGGGGGALYRLTFDQGKGQLSVLALRDDREVVCVGRAGRVILANPALGDRAAWAGIRDRLKA